MKTDQYSRIITLSLLAAGFYFDSGGLLRFAIIAACIHEIGHIVAYVILCKRIPKIKTSALGFSLDVNGESFTIFRENILLLAGPLANFIVSLVGYFYLQVNVSYSGYFFVAENLLLGIFNLLPIGFLDGGKIIKNYFITHKKSGNIKFSIIALILLFCVLVTYNFRLNISATTTIFYTIILVFIGLYILKE